MTILMLKTSSEIRLSARNVELWKSGWTPYVTLGRSAQRRSYTFITLSKNEHFLICRLALFLITITLEVYDSLEAYKNRGPINMDQ